VWVSVVVAGDTTNAIQGAFIKGSPSMPDADCYSCTAVELAVAV
jgi:hypothetical protein